MKSVLISIQPRWCDLIARGMKTVEVRKSRPKLEPPFKCYIYCTVGKRYKRKSAPAESLYFGDGTELSNGKIIGEFLCDRFFPYCGGRPIENALGIEEAACLSKKQILEYEPKGNPIGWHISKLKIYDKPKSIVYFYFPMDKYCEKGLCGGCQYDCVPGESGDVMFDCEWKRPLKRPPQSWCYVEEQEDS